MRTNFLTSAKDDLAKAFFDIDDLIQEMYKSIDIVTDYPPDISVSEEDAIRDYLKELEALQKDNFDIFVGLSEL